MLVLLLKLLVNFSAEDILNYFSYFSQETGLDISCKLSPMKTTCVRCQLLFSGKNKKNIINLSSAEFAQGALKLKKSTIFLSRAYGEFLETLFIWNYYEKHMATIIY